MKLTNEAKTRKPKTPAFWCLLILSVVCVVLTLVSWLLSHLMADAAFLSGILSVSAPTAGILNVSGDIAAITYAMGGLTLLCGVVLGIVVWRKL